MSAVGLEGTLKMIRSGNATVAAASLAVGVDEPDLYGRPFAALPVPSAHTGGKMVEAEAVAATSGTRSPVSIAAVAQHWPRRREYWSRSNDTR
jgi:hypothetical protein